MKKYLLPLLTPIFTLCFFQASFAQVNKGIKKPQQILMTAEEKEKLKNDPSVFNEANAIEQAKAKGIKASDINGYVEFLRNDFSSKKSLKNQKHIHTPYENPGNIEETVIYIEPGKPMSIGCPNMGFENYDFSGWTGGIGTVSTGGTYPNYTSTGTTIQNGAGSNVSVNNTTNYHTIMTLPPVSNVWPNVNGWDSLACKAVGSQTISQIPVVSPFSFDPVSVRMNGAAANYRACRLKFITTTSSTNQRLSFSYAVVLQNPSGHTAGESPYFKVEVKNEATGTVLPGCTSYTFNPKSTVPADSLFQSNVGSAFDPTFYRKWQYYSVDLSTLPIGTSISLNFEVGGCTQSGHWGYAYVDAECGGIGNAYANMCSGSTFATLVAPTGFTSYQWLDGSGPIAGATNDTLIVNPATPGTTYTVSLVSPGGCALSQTVQVQLTTVNIINLNTTSSCAGGASGSAYVQASGSNGIYTYTWTSTSGPTTGSVVSNSQVATNLAPGSYSVLVASTTCGIASANVSVGVSPPFFYSQSHPFCGNSTYIIKPGGTNYKWYQGTTLIPAPNGTNDTLYIANAVAGAQYSLLYTTPFGCQDSIKYTLVSIAGGNSYVSNVANVCPGNANGSALLNLNTPFSAPYSYTVTNSNGSIILNTSTSSTNVAVSPLPLGSYTATIYDGTCVYTNTFAINNIVTSFTASATNTVLCFPTDTAKVYLSFGDQIPANCGLSSGIGCTSPNIIQVGTGSVQNTSTSMPCVFGNFYKNNRHQLLFTAAELLAAGVTPGKISSMAFDVVSTQPKQVPTGNGSSIYSSIPFNYTIKMKCTNANVLTSTFDNTGLLQVFTGSHSASPGWNTLNFNSAYEWDGTSSILVDICYDLQTYYTSNPIMNSTNVGSNRTLWYQSDATVACGYTGTGTLSNNRANVRFGNCGAVNPSTFTISVSSNGSIATNYANDSLKVVPTFTAPPYPSAAIVYTFTAINPEGGCVATRTLAILYPSVSTSITTSSSSNSVCIGSQVTLGATGAADYSWTYLQNGTTPIPISTSSTINVTPPAAGPNYYVVTGTSPCTSSTDTKTITVFVSPKAELMISPLVDITKCMNRDFIITTGVSSTNTVTGLPYTYSWTTLPGNLPAPGNNTSSSYTCSSNGTTTLVVTVNGDCANSTQDTIVISNFADNLSVSIIDSSSTCANTEFVLNSSASGGYPDYSYAWFFGTGSNSISNSSSLTFTSPNTEGIYTIAIQVMDSCGYTKTDYQLITVLPPCGIEIPNIITPNGDGVNEAFIIKNIEHHPNTAVSIFDRWGKKVFESSNYNNEWKGEGVSDGTFFYVVDVPDDKSYNGFITVFKGK